jgi:hypothetical protein
MVKNASGNAALTRMTSFPEMARLVEHQKCVCLRHERGTQSVWE